MMAYFTPEAKHMDGDAKFLLDSMSSLDVVVNPPLKNFIHLK